MSEEKHEDYAEHCPVCGADFAGQALSRANIELSTEREARGRAEAALCRAREACNTWVPGWGSEDIKMHVEAALSSSTPCAHAERVKVLEEAVEWALSDSYRDALREYGLALEAGCDPNGAWSSVRHELGKWREEIRRRAGRGE